MSMNTLVSVGHTDIIVIAVRRISHCEKKLAQLLFDFGVVKTTDDDCEQQFPSVALRL